MKVLLAVGLALALNAALYAQDGLRSASLPERPIATQPPGPNDLYRAGPKTYRPRPDRKPPRVEPPLVDRGYRGYPGYLTGYSYWPYTETPESEFARNQPGPVGDVGFLQLRISPADALVYVDGVLEGAAADLRWPGSSLRPGTHRVRVEAAGYQTLTLDVRITTGQTVTFSQVLDRAPALPSRAVSPDPVAAKTMYVIPRCYAGDKPPDASSGCDLTKLRTIR